MPIINRKLLQEVEYNILHGITLGGNNSIDFPESPQIEATMYAARMLEIESTNEESELVQRFRG